MLSVSQLVHLWMHAEINLRTLLVITETIARFFYLVRSRILVEPDTLLPGSRSPKNRDDLSQQKEKGGVGGKFQEGRREKSTIANATKGTGWRLKFPTRFGN